MRKKIGLLLSCAILVLTACGETEKPVNENVDSSPTAAPKIEREYPDNMFAYFEYTYGDPDGLYGNTDYTREDIVTVTFKDTLEGMPEDAWDISEKNDGSVMAWVENDENLFFAGEGGVTANPNCDNLFKGYRNLTHIYFNNCFYTDLVETMMNMFDSCFELQELDLSFFYTSNTVKMCNMFGSCESLTKLDVSSFDTSNVDNMNSMFFGCSDLTELDVSHFNTSNVKDMTQMFSGCTDLTFLDVSGFDTSKVTSMFQTFSRCKSLTTLDVSGFDTSLVDDMCGMFQQCHALTEVDLTGFVTDKVTRFRSMFQECTSMTEVDLSSFDYSSAETAQDMFRDSTISNVIGDINLPSDCDTTDMYTGTTLN